MQLPEQHSWLLAQVAPFIWQVSPASSGGQPRSTHWLLRQALTQGLLPSLQTVAQLAAGLIGQSAVVVHERASLPEPASAGGPDPASSGGQPRSTHWLLRQVLTQGLLPSLQTVAQLAAGLIGQSAVVVHEPAVSRASAPSTAGRASSAPMGSWEDELHWNPKRGIVMATPATHRTMTER
jgi:hypothetical protein